MVAVPYIFKQDWKGTPESAQRPSYQRYIQATEFDLKELAQFFGLAIGWTWVWWWLTVLVNNTKEASAKVMMVVGGYGPFVAAMAMSYRSGGKQAMVDLLKRSFQLKSIPYWIWAVTLTVTFWVYVGAAFFSNGATFKPTAFIWVIAYALITWLLGGPFAEEYGWRGFALDRLQLRFDATVSALIIGVFWTLWHLPLWFKKGAYEGGVSDMGVFALSNFADSFICSWLYNCSGGNLTVAIIHHIGTNTSDVFFDVEKKRLAKAEMCIVYVSWILVVFYILPIFGYKTLAGDMQVNVLPKDSTVSVELVTDTQDKDKETEEENDDSAELR